jgi:hypothetical protein
LAAPGRCRLLVLGVQVLLMQAVTGDRLRRRRPGRARGLGAAAVEGLVLLLPPAAWGSVGER